MLGIEPGSSARVVQSLNHGIVMSPNLGNTPPQWGVVIVVSQLVMVLRIRTVAVAYTQCLAINYSKTQGTLQKRQNGGGVVLCALYLL